MSRAMSALSASAAWPLAGIGRYLTLFWQEITRDALRPYRPERHYMRGPGPAWHAKHGGPAR